VEATAAASGVVETFPEPPPTSAVQSTPAPGEGDIETLLRQVDRMQLRHAQTTVKGGQRVVATVEKTLEHLARQLEHLARAKTLDGDLPKVLEDVTLAVEQMSKVRSGLQALAVQLGRAITEEPEVNDAASRAPAQSPRKKEARGKR